MLRRLYLLLGVLIALSAGLASAQNVLEQARLRAYLFDVSISFNEKACSEKHPELSESLAVGRQQFHQKLLPEIELGKEFGRTQMAARGRDIQKEAEQLAFRSMARSLATSSRSSREICEESIREINDWAKWTIDDFLRMDFESLVMDVGNRQGLPCDLIAMRFEPIARRFVEVRGKSTDPQQVLDQLLFFEVRDLENKVSNCIAVQARAAEYRVVPTRELQTIQEVLVSLHSALMPDWERRVEKGEAERVATQRVRDFLFERRKNDR